MKKIRIAILDAYTTVRDDLDWSPLEKFGTVYSFDRTPPELIVERARSADAVLVNKVPMFAEQLGGLPNLKYVGVLATGYNNVDLKFARSRGIPVSNAPGYGTDSVAQAVFAHILNISNRVQAHSEAVERGEWARSRDVCFCLSATVELSGKTLGVFGYGAIGRRVAEIGAAFGMRALAFSPSRAAGTRDAVAEFVSAGELFSRSDIISLNCPLNDATAGIVCAQTIAKMRRGVWIINAGRGGLVDEGALAEALERGVVGAAGLDVLCEEPPVSGSPLIGAPNCFITPHNAWATREARARLIEIAAENIASWLEGRPRNIVN